MSTAIPVRMLNEIQYCERLFYLMHVQGLFEHNADTIEGTFQHQKSESRLRIKQNVPDDLWGEAPRSLYLGDEELNITGRLDALLVENNKWAPLEWKHSSSPTPSKPFIVNDYQLEPTAWPNDQIQICAQGLLLRKNGYPSDFGYLYYRGNKKKIKVDFTDNLVRLTLDYIQLAKELTKKEIPKPLKDSNKCFRCSLNYICLPDETNYLTGSATQVRRIVPERPDGGVLYVSEHGTKLGKSGDCLTITKPSKDTQTIPIKDLIHVTVMGNVQCSTQLIHTLMASGITVSYLSSHGKLIGITQPLTTKNIRLRQKQFIQFQHPEISLRLARWVVHSKLSNQRTLLRRNGKPGDQVLKELALLKEKALVATDIEKLRGLEGRAGRLYFESFPTMLKSPVVDGVSLMNGRNRRPPKDPVNALLSLGYTLLVRDFMVACINVGMDPLFGFYHRSEPGRPSLALDLMEAFRPVIVDSVVIRVMNTLEIQPDDFYWSSENCQLKQQPKKRFFAAYERRMHDTVTHPLFQYKINYRRTLDLEVRLLARFLEGELSEYRPFMIR